MGKVYFLTPTAKEERVFTPMGRKIHPFAGDIAVKQPKSTEFSEAFERENKIWLELGHRHIVPLLRVIEVNGVMAAIMPLYHQSLRQLMVENKLLNGEFLAKQVIGILDGLNHALEFRGYLHLDIKPENVLVFNHRGRLEFGLSDWGMARMQDASYEQLGLRGSTVKKVNSLAAYGGTLPYMSPDRLRSLILREEYRHTFKDDLFSIGIMLLEIVTGHNPCTIEAQREEDVVQRIVTGSYRQFIGLMPEGKKSLLFRIGMMCCAYESSNRPSGYRDVIREIESHV
jgi:serine/threonine protein kinase